MQRLSNKGNSYLEAIQLLTPAQTQEGTDWLKMLRRTLSLSV